VHVKFKHREYISMLEVSRDTKESQYFQTNCLFEHVFVGHEDGKEHQVNIRILQKRRKDIHLKQIKVASGFL
jgi:hypothetical protein